MDDCCSINANNCKTSGDFSFSGIIGGFNVAFIHCAHSTIKCICFAFFYFYRNFLRSYTENELVIEYINNLNLEDNRESGISKKVRDVCSVCGQNPNNINYILKKCESKVSATVNKDQS